MPEAREGASEEELALREAILCTLTATVGPMPAKKAISALAPVIALYGNLLTRAMSVCLNLIIRSVVLCDSACRMYGKLFFRPKGTAISTQSCGWCWKRWLIVSVQVSLLKKWEK